MCFHLCSNKQTEPLKQNDAELLPIIQEVGCFFRASLRMAEMEAEKQRGYNFLLNASQINLLWKVSQQKRYINEKNEMTCSAPIANLALDMLGIHGKFVEVATFKDGKMGWYPVIEEKRAGYYIQKINQAGPNKTHYRNVTKEAIKLWDPHNPEIEPTGICYTICYRYDKDAK